MSSSGVTSIDRQVLGFCLNIDFFNKVKNKIDRTMFDNELKEVFDNIVYSHTKYGRSLTVVELSSIFNDRNPALPESSRKRVQEIISELVAPKESDELHTDIVNNLWLRDRARQIGEKALEIFTGDSDEFGELKKLIDAVDDGRIGDKTTYTIIDKGLDQLLSEETGDNDFPFSFSLINENIKGLDRGNLGIIFARPEVGKTTFCCFLAASYIKQGFQVVYWANEEPASRIKLRIIQSYFELTKREMVEQRFELVERYQKEIEPYLVIMDSVGTSVEEVDEYAKLNKPDIMFCQFKI